MITTKIDYHRALQLTLYSSIVLIVVSVLFLGRGLTSASFLDHAVSVLAAPLFFYIVGLVVRRSLNAPLAAPGIIATGAWLVAVALIHLYIKRTLLPDVIQPYYWLCASILGAVLLTITGHHIRFWMLTPLVPLAQTVAVWAFMWAVQVPVIWMPSVSFLLVIVWWELRLNDDEWVSIYRISGIVLTLFLLLMPVLLMQEPLMVTWGTGVIVLALLGLRHGWVRLAPLAISILFCASMWTLPFTWWPPAWLALAVMTIVFIERMVVRREQSAIESGEHEATHTTYNKFVELSEALAVLLTGAAAVYAQVSQPFGAYPIGVIGVLTVAGILLTWLGWRRNLQIASHAGLWLLAGAWIDIYFFAVPRTNTFGLWLALFAAGALLIERVAASKRKEKNKTQHTVLQTITFWPLADLTIGLSALILLWTGYSITSATPQVLTVTLAITVGIWVAAGLLYRLPVLLHVALWIAPIPYALMLILAAPSLWRLPMLGVAWQLFGVVLLLVGHSAPRYRPAILMPFFIVGYVLLGFGFTLAANSSILAPASLTLIVLAAIGTSVAVILDRHPTWSVFVAWLIDPEKRPYAYKNVHQAFLVLAAWLSGIWLHLMLGYTGMALPQQGLLMVGFSCAWFVLGRLLSRLPGVVGWPVTSAGWLMWFIGLLEVFFSPAEALITMIVGLLVSAEAIRRSRDIYWIPPLIMQLFFTAFQLAWLLALPRHVILLIVAMVVCIAGMFYERYHQKAGLITMITGGALAGVVWAFQPSANTLIGVTVLMIIALLHYRYWQLLFAIYPAVAAIIIQLHIPIHWQSVFIFGIVQWVLGAELAKALRPRRYRTMSSLLGAEYDWATLPMGVGLLCIVGALFVSVRYGTTATLTAYGFTALLFSVYSIRLRVRNLPYIPLVLMGSGLMMWLFVPMWSFDDLKFNAFTIAISMSLSAVVGYAVFTYLVSHPYLLNGKRWLVWWIRPVLRSTYLLSAVSFVLMLFLRFPSPQLTMLNTLLLAAFMALVYRKRRQMADLFIAGGFVWYAWTLGLTALNLTSILWHTLPIGVAMLIAARKYPQHAVLEYTGVFTLIAGSALSVDRSDLLSIASVGLAAHVLGLLVYGYAGQRRVPFVSALLVITGGLIYGIVLVNMWLVPLVGGVLLMTITLVVEVQREAAEQWVTGWVSRWQGWR